MSDSLATRLGRFADLLRSAPHNLLSPRGLDELEVRHFPESVAFATMLPSESTVLDIGSGGGLPGLVVAMARPDLSVHLLEATGKKANFLSDAAQQLGLSVTVHHGRAEELATGALAGRFDVVTARAVAPLERLVPWASPFLREGGTLHAIKGDRWEAELEEAARAVKDSRMEVVRTPRDVPTSDAGPMPPKVVVLRRRGGVG